MHNYNDDRDYGKMTKAELIKLLNEKDNLIDSLQWEMERLEEGNDHLSRENEHCKRNIYDYKEKEKRWRFYKEFPHMRQPLDDDLL